MKKLFIGVLLICMFCMMGCTVQSSPKTSQSGLTSTTFE